MKGNNMTRHVYNYSKDKYSFWHRKWENLAMLDLDSLEICPKCYLPIACIETAMYKGHLQKTTYVTEFVANRLDVPAYMVFYYEVKTADYGASEPHIRTKEYPMSLRFIWRNLSENTAFIETDEVVWSQELYKLHENHKNWCKKCQK